MMALMMLSVIDRSNVSYAKLQMVSGLGMSETAYGLASSAVTQLLYRVV